uniref:Gag1-like clamp domain-containing protein n=1 Tax=Arundo donax TaxID=35708 RepID=A0A0A9HSW0_ARUDO
MNHVCWVQGSFHFAEQPVVSSYPPLFVKKKTSWNATYESLLGSYKPLTQPIPLHEMVDFLVDIWEQESLYDWKMT